MKANIRSKYETIRLMCFEDRSSLHVNIFSDYLKENLGCHWKEAIEYWFDALEKTEGFGPENDWTFLPGLRFDPFDEDFITDSYLQKGWRGIENIEICFGLAKLWPILIEKPVLNIDQALAEIASTYELSNRTTTNYYINQIHERHWEIWLNTVWSDDMKMMAWETTLHVFSF